MNDHILTAFDYDEVLAAAGANKYLIVSKWLQSLCPSENPNTSDKLAQVLKHSAQNLSVDVITLFQPPAFSKQALHKIINATDHNGMTLIHHAAQGQGHKSNTNATHDYDMLETLTHLCEHGGDPTILCKQGKTAKTILQDRNKRIAVILMGILENMQCQVLKRSPNAEYADIIAIHKTLLHWAVHTSRHLIVTHILIMHQWDKNIDHMVFEVDPNSPVSFQEAPIFTAAKIHNPKLSEALVHHCGISPNILFGYKREKTVYLIDGTSRIQVDTPLSLILSSQNYPFIDALVELRDLFYDCCLTSVDLSCTNIRSLPVELFKLNSLYHLNVSNNKLSELLLPNACQHHLLRLEDLIISYNALECIPSELFSIPCLKTLDESHNPLKSLPEQWWASMSTVAFDVSFTQLEDLSIKVDPLTSQIIDSSEDLLQHWDRVHGKRSNFELNYSVSSDDKHKADSSLQSLNASHCNIKQFPGLLALFFPNLEILDLSNNKLKFCCAINELPTSLRKLDISKNLLANSDDHNYKVFYHDKNLSTKSSCMSHKDLCRLQNLSLADNVDLKALRISDDTIADDGHVFFPRLQRLNLSNCGLHVVPHNLVQLGDITDLDLSHNKDLMIPKVLSGLEGLVCFNYDGIMDPIVNELSRFLLVRDKLLYLRESHAIRSPSIELILLGHDETDLVSSLSNTALMGKDYCLVVADEYTWCVSKSKIPDYIINFNVWNFTNQSEHNPASQCFFTENALYVLCWHITDDKDYGACKLRSSLLNIQAQLTTKASVVIVGCKSTRVGKHLKCSLISKIQSLYGDGSAFYPLIIGVKFVSTSKLMHHIPKLWSYLYDTASDLRILRSTKVVQTVKETKVPIKYFKLQGLLSQKMKQKEDGPPILTWKEMILMVGLDNHKNALSLFTDEKDFEVAVKYMKNIGMIMHLDYPGLSDYYFIDPHWLYNVFRRVCTSSMLTSSSINRDDGKVNRSQIQQIFDEYKIPMQYSKVMLKLLCIFEVAIPLDSETLLLPSALTNNFQHKVYFSTNCNFPRKSLAEIKSSCKTRNPSFEGMFPPIDAHILPKHKRMNLLSTGVCYRRLFIAHHVPESFWRKLIPRFITSAKIFYNILLNNCIEGITVEKMSNTGDALICNNQCKWLYWCNGITLTLEDNVLLCINGLLQQDSSNEVNHKTPLSMMVDKYKAVNSFDGYQWKQLFPSDLIEVKVPDYLVESSSEEHCEVYSSSKLGSQILSHVLEILNELSIDFVKGDFDKGIYFGSYFTQLVPCPYCLGDQSVSASIIDNSQAEILRTETLYNLYTESIQSISVTENLTNQNISGLVGFSIQFCILKAQKHKSHVDCPIHGWLKLKYLTPDLMFEDVTLNKVSAAEVEQPIGSRGGRFGAMYKVKHPLEPDQYAALKCFTKDIINDKVRKYTLQDLAGVYASIRLELNKLSSVEHPYIIKFLGLCVISFSFLLEWAPKGSLHQIIQSYKLAESVICPDTAALTVLQVSSALAYLHTKKNIVHFDIKPGNVLVFKYPQPGHYCFSSESSLTCDSCYGGGGGVLVKLADLGISAFFGPGGFQRRRTTPGYAAPEVFKYLGKLPLSEKVDIFSLGSLLYTILTLRELPPGNLCLEYSADIVAGRRPKFLSEDPNYPLPLMECIQSCWAQESTQRPTARTIEESFKDPNFITLKNYYRTEDIKVSAVLVTKVNVAREIVWVATTKDMTNTLMCYTFSPQNIFMITKPRNKHVHPILCKMKSTVQLNGCVKEMCHYGQHIWILYTSGYVAVFDMESHKIIQNIELQELSNDPVTILVADHTAGLIAAAYTNGLVVYLWDGTIPNVSIDYFHSTNTITVTYQDYKLTAVESCSDDDGHCHLWCGYSIGVIQIVSPPDSTHRETTVIKVLNYSTELPSDVNFVQMKYSSDQKIMYALLDQSVISCWSVGTNPKLCTMIRPPLDAPASVLLPVGNAIFIGDTNGKVMAIYIQKIEEGKYSSQLLPGGHRLGRKVDYLLTLQGRLNHQGLLSAVGDTKIISNERRPSVCYFKRLDNIPCTVLLSIGVGHQEMFKQCPLHATDDSINFVTWALPSCIYS